MAKPVNVRIVRPDGTEMACELVHEGYDAEQDMDNWSVAGVVFRPGLEMLKADLMPARTSIDFAVQRPPDDEPFWRQR